ncbi:MAG: hypothetical protein WKF84_07060 [Pyrinomonadaceae bacterium]
MEAFYYTESYNPQSTTVISLGTGKYRRRAEPTWIWPWLRWLLSELLRSPGDQQTDIVRRHFPDMPFYRLDPEISHDIPLDDTASLKRLYRLGEQFSTSINWEMILNGTDERFRVADVKAPGAVKVNLGTVAGEEWKNVNQN